MRDTLLFFIIPFVSLVAIIISAFVLHTLGRNKFKLNQIETIVLVIFALGILPILPNDTVDPWGLFNPRNFGILIVTIAAIQFGGYVSVRLFGERMGMALTGFLGGLVSSTAVFANLGHALRTYPKLTHAIMASALLAILAMLVEIIAILLVASPTLLVFIIKPILMMSSITLVFAVSLLHYQKTKERIIYKISDPLHFGSVIRTALLIAGILILIAVAKQFVGTEGVLLISFLGGLFEIHGITLATTLLYLGQHLTLYAAREILFTAILASFISKFFLAWTLTPANFSSKISLFLLGILLSGALVYFIF